jgi:DedD protein
MGLFSFGNKDASSTSGRGNTASGAASARTSRRTAERGQPVEGLRRRRSSEPADANMLDPTLPEKQRARRRLIGAIALVLAAVVVLPMVLDSHPKPATDGIAIEIPAHDEAPAPGAPGAPSQSSTTAYEAAAGDDDGAASGAAPSTDVAQNATAATNGVTAPGSTGAAANRKDAANGVANTGSTASRAASSPSASVDKKSSKPAIPTDTNTTVATAAKAPTANDAPPAGSHFVVQIGTFSADAPAQAWVTRLKAAGVPAYVQHSRQDDGSDRVLVRAGPFADRTAAETAVRKVRTVDAPADGAAAPGAQGAQGQTR